MPRWVLLAGYWAIQGVVVYAAAAAWVTLNVLSGGTDAPLYRFEIGEFFELMADAEWAVRTAAAIGVFTLMQAGLLWPVARPSFNRDGHGTPVWVSAAAAGAAIAVVWAGVVLAAAGAWQLFASDTTTAWMERTLLIVLGVSMVVAWAVATPLVARFVSRGRREDRLARLSAMIFMGTVVEAVAIVPLDVMMRRKTSCYCDTGTFWALTACGTVGLFVLGPAMFLPVLARRRRRWYAGRCDACGYDMRATPRALRCPECGAGWRGWE